MRTLSPEFAGHLAGDSTTLCHCWRLTRRDGVVLGFTDHDRELMLDGQLYLAGAGFEASTASSESGLPAGASDVRGGFSSELITETDLLAGRYDGARVEVFAVNWANPEQHVLLRVEEIGEVTRSAQDFTAELRPFTQRLQQVQGRIYTRSCGAALGDKACGLTLRPGIHIFAGTIAAVASSSRLTVTLKAGPDAGAFARGALRFAGGALKGITVDIDRHGVEGGQQVLDLWLPLSVLPFAGDAVELTVGCDKSAETCRSRFGNGLNFQGFPHMPGADFAYSYADRETAHDGSPLIP